MARPPGPVRRLLGRPLSGLRRRLPGRSVRWPALLAPLALPWSVQAFAVGDVTLLFPWGLVNTAPPNVTDLYSFLFRYTAGLPGFILAWPLSVLLYGLGLGSGALARAGLEDPRLTAGLLALAGLAQLSLAWGFSVQPGRVAYPTGTLLLVGVAWWYRQASG